MDEFQIDQLKEIMNIGASHASTALSQMVEQRVDLTIPYVYIDTIDNLDKHFTNLDQQVSISSVRVFGDIGGLMYFLFMHKNEKKLIDLLLTNIRKDKDKKAIESSVIKELGNVLAGASLSAFSKFLDMDLLHAVSAPLVRSLRDVVKKIGADVAGETGMFLMFQIDFNIKENEIGTNFMFFINAEATNKILEALKLKY